jgi:hypothetical protein
MYALSINKKMDYSIPIIFSSTFVKTSADEPLKEQKQKAVAPKVAAPKPATVTKPIKKEAEKATTIETPSKTIEAKKIVEPVKKIVPIEATKPVIEKKAVGQKTETKKEEIPTPVEKKLETKNESPLKPVPDAAQVSNNFREVEALRRGAQLQKELVQKWQPPIGVSPDCTCDISFFVNKQGTIENLKMVKSSGVMMFDISARQALFAMKMPQWTYGKPLIINFKQ